VQEKVFHRHSPSLISFSHIYTPKGRYIKYIAAVSVAQSPLATTASTPAEAATTALTAAPTSLFTGALKLLKAFARLLTPLPVLGFLLQPLHLFASSLTSKG
jgi:hypothetical protein